MSPTTQDRPGQHQLIGLGCKVAAALDEWCAAFSLIYDCYRREGLSEDCPSGMRVTPHHLLPTTSTIIARFQDSIIGTLTLIRDSQDGLPIESVYGAEVAAMRREGHVLAEVSCLATEPLSRTEYPYVCMRLMRFLGQHARFLGVERLLIATHPRHFPFYRHTMGFRGFGRETSYPTVAGAPAVAALMDFCDVDVQRPRLYEECFGKPIHREALLPCPMPPHIVDELRPLTSDLAENEFASCWRNYSSDISIDIPAEPLMPELV